MPLSSRTPRSPELTALVGIDQDLTAEATRTSDRCCHAIPV